MSTNIEILWETYEFHTKQISDLESIHEKYDSDLNLIMNNDVVFKPLMTNGMKATLKKDIIKNCDLLHSSYNKQISTLSDMIDCYANSSSIPEGMEMDSDYLIELKSLTEELQYSIAIFKETAIEILS